LTAMRKAFASKEITETVFMPRLERLERQSWQFAEATKALAGHVAGIADVVNAWLAPSRSAAPSLAVSRAQPVRGARGPPQRRPRNDVLTSAKRAEALKHAKYDATASLRTADVLLGKFNKDISFALRRGTIAQVTTHHHLALDGFAWLRLASPGYAWPTRRR
jgi:hypothetical protein